MAEEQKWQEPGGHKLCANNCGFFGSPTTLNLCSKCYKDYCLKEQQMSKAKLAMEKTLIQSESESESESESGSGSSSAMSSVSISSSDPFLPPKEAPVTASTASAGPPPATTGPNRCAACRRRVGLTGFACRCGPTFCGTHRYPEQHGCTFDFKALGKEAIAKANPVVKAEKLQKI